MNLINESINLTLDIESTLPYAPDKQCFDWCLMQQVVHSNNMELYAVMFVLFAFLSLQGYYIANEFDASRPYRENFIYYARLLLLVFFGVYILIIRLRLIW